MSRKIIERRIAVLEDKLKSKTASLKDLNDLVELQYQYCVFKNALALKVGLNATTEEECLAHYDTVLELVHNSIFSRFNYANIDEATFTKRETARKTLETLYVLGGEMKEKYVFTPTGYPKMVSEYITKFLDIFEGFRLLFLSDEIKKVID